MSDKIKTGNQGEKLAADYLEKKGFEVIARNFRFGKAEIDLIVKRDNWMIFVEVKTRSSTAFGEPEEFVDDFKGNRIFEAAEEFIYAQDWRGHIRFDIISVKLGGEVVIEHFEDAIN
jgi:putative endonuclease